VNVYRQYEITVGGSLAYTVFAGAPSLTFNLLGGNDVLMVDGDNKPGSLARISHTLATLNQVSAAGSRRPTLLDNFDSSVMAQRNVCVSSKTLISRRDPQSP